MIFELLFQMVSFLITTVFGIFPNLPQMSPSIQNAGDFVISIIAVPINLMTYLYTAPFMVAMVAMLILLFNFERAYHLTMFIVKKLPFLNIK